MGRINLIEKYRFCLLRAAAALLIAVTGGLCVRGQVPASEQRPLTGEQSIRMQGDLKESFRLLTDRSTYIAGEEILFTVFNLSLAELKDPTWSRIIYIELLSHDNRAIARQKLRLDPEGANGVIRLPESPASGFYYLRAYTRWMRNFPPESYPARRLRIINPSTDELSIPPGSAASSKPDASSVRDTTSIQEPPAPADGDNDEMIRVELEAGKKVFGKREEVSYSVSVPGGMSPGGLSVTVIPPGMREDFGSLNYPLAESLASGFTAGSINIPETRGMAISGKVVDRISGEPLENSRVQLSLIGEEPDYFGYLTGKDGNFHIALPDYTGMKDFYIGAEIRGKDRADILVDQDFCTRYPEPVPVEFRIGQEEQALIEEMILNAKVSDLYGPYGVKPDAPGPDSLQQKNFYGEPWFTIMVDEFVKLPSLEEFIYELVPMTRVQRRGGKASLVMMGDYSDLAIYSPLILLDHVAVTDISTILDVSPEKIASIDLINATYIRGNINYGGILSITSKNRDLAGIDLPEDSYFFNFSTLNREIPVEFPDYSEDPGNLRSPDFRNCLYWKPYFRPLPGEAYSDRFFTSDRSGEYIIRVRGYAPDGRPLSGSARFTVE